MYQETYITTPTSTHQQQKRENMINSVSMKRRKWTRIRSRLINLMMVDTIGYQRSKDHRQMGRYWQTENTKKRGSREGRIDQFQFGQAYFEKLITCQFDYCGHNELSHVENNDVVGMNFAVVMTFSVKHPDNFSPQNVNRETPRCLEPAQGLQSTVVICPLVE